MLDVPPPPSAFLDYYFIVVFSGELLAFLVTAILLKRYLEALTWKQAVRIALIVTVCSFMFGWLFWWRMELI